MRILHVIPWLAPRYGGPAILVPQASAALHLRGHDVEIVTTNIDRHGVLEIPTGGAVEWSGATVTFHPLGRPRSFATSWRLLADVHRRASAFDVLHIHYLYRFPGIAASIAAAHAGVPYLIQAHGALDPWTRSRKRRAKDMYHFLIEDRVIRGAAGIVATSAQEREGVRRLGYEEPIYIVPCGIDADALRQPAPRDLLTRKGVPVQSRIVSFLGRISRGKGTDLLIDAFQETASIFEDAHLVIAGPDDEGRQPDLVARSIELNLGSRVSFVGRLDGADKRALLQASEVLVMPSVAESFGMAAAEAMAVGCPVVVTAGVAISGAIAENGAGFVVGRNVADLASAVNAILGNPNAHRMRVAAKALVDRLYAWPVVARAAEAMYATVIDASSLHHGTSEMSS